jgi:hypothetical protein
VWSYQRFAPPLRVGSLRVTRPPGGGALEDDPIVKRLPPELDVGVEGENGAALLLLAPNEKPLPDAGGWGNPELLVAGEAG